jgi:hypothetical protein
VPDDLSAAAGELAALRAANARLRQVAEARDIEIAALRAAVEAGQARGPGRQAEEIRFTGWLGLLRALYEATGAPYTGPGRGP